MISTLSQNLYSASKQKKRVEIIFESDTERSDTERSEFLPPEPHFGLRLKSPFSLFPHQVEAIEWMKQLENSNPKRLNMRGGILAESPGLGKCLHPETPVLMFGEKTNNEHKTGPYPCIGLSKKAMDIVSGDLILGDDNLPRRVISVVKGRDEMFRIDQSNGDSYIVNREHILSLKYIDHKRYILENGKFKISWIDTRSILEHTATFDIFEEMIEFSYMISEEDTIDIEVYKYLDLDSSLKSKLVGFKTGFDGWSSCNVSIDPWTVGYCLGQGRTLEIVSQQVSSRLRYIPQEYIYNSRKKRLQLLSGFLDSCGIINTGNDGNDVSVRGCELIFDSHDSHDSCGISNQVLFVCRSLGFEACRTIFQVSSRLCYKIIFNGNDIGKLPIIFFKKRLQNLDTNNIRHKKYYNESLSLFSGIKVESLGQGDYCGFVIDGNRRFLLGDFTVTHNTCITASLCMTDSITSIGSRIVYPNLVVCSKTVAYSWKNEIEKFFGKSCPFLYIHRSSLGKSFDLLSWDSIKNYKIIITTYETVMSVATKNKLIENQLGVDNLNRKVRMPSHDDCINVRGGMLLFKVPWNRIIADESHRLSNPTSSTFYSMMALWGDKKWNLSGTPLRNYSSDLFSQFRFNGYDKILVAKQFNFDEYQRGRMREFTLYKTYDDAKIYLPEIKRHKIEIVFEDKEKEIYEYYHSSMRKVYNGFLVGSYGFSNVLTLFLRLRQLCVVPYSILSESSRNYKKKEDEEYTLSQQILDDMTGGLSSWLTNKMGTAGIYSSKMKALINILKNVKKGEKTLVFSSFKKVIDIGALAVKTLLSHVKFLVLDGDVTGDNRDDVINKFKSDKHEYEVLFISYKVGSEGLTLVEASNVVHMENWWTPVVQEQAERRVWRIGQKREVNIFNITIKDSIEDRIDAICQDKSQMISDFKSSKKSSIRSLIDSAMIGRMIR